MNANVEIGKIYFKPFSELNLYDFNLSDSKGNPILSAKKLNADLILTDYFQNKIVIERLNIEKAYVDFQVYKDSSNLKFLIDYFAPKKKKDQTPKKKMELKLYEVNLVDNYVKIINHTQKHHSRGVDFSDIELTHLTGNFSKIEQDSTTLKAIIKKLSFQEKSGFKVKELSSHAVVTDKFMEFDNLKLLTNNSTLGNYLKFSYKDFGDFGDFCKES
ncbi:Uncharacterised protein [Sphingobacterium daejeonense]|nr:Uncharacterised protein [Sphingobacterium daejeonense]